MMVSVALPRRGCVLSVRLEPGVDKTVTASWYDIWAAAIAVQQICVARGRSGATVDVGMLYFLFFSPIALASPLGALILLDSTAATLTSCSDSFEFGIIPSGDYMGVGEVKLMFGSRMADEPNRSNDGGSTAEDSAGGCGCG